MIVCVDYLRITDIYPEVYMGFNNYGFLLTGLKIIETGWGNPDE
jgi:hypothetical protein